MGQQRQHQRHPHKMVSIKKKTYLMIMKDSTFERLHHEKSKQGNIKDIEEKISIIKDISQDCTDECIKQYYKGYVQAYMDCIQLIQKDKHY